VNTSYALAIQYNNKENNTKDTPFNLVYGKEVVAPTKFVIPNMFIVKTTKPSEEASIQICIKKLMGLEEDRFLEQCH
jgi:hypothetical protein